MPQTIDKPKVNIWVELFAITLEMVQPTIFLQCIMRRRLLLYPPLLKKMAICPSVTDRRSWVCVIRQPGKFYVKSHIKYSCFRAETGPITAYYFRTKNLRTAERKSNFYRKIFRDKAQFCLMGTSINSFSNLKSSHKLFNALWKMHCLVRLIGRRAHLNVLLKRP